MRINVYKCEVTVTLFKSYKMVSTYDRGLNKWWEPCFLSGSIKEMVELVYGNNLGN